MAFAVLGLVLALIGIAISGLLLWLSCKMMKVKSDWAIPFTIAVMVGVVNYVIGLLPVPMISIVALVVTVVLGLWLVKTKYKLAWSKAIIVWLIWFVLGLIVSAIIGMIVAAVFVGGALATGGA